jgi:hypothetical protein
MTTDYNASAVYGLFIEADLIQTMLDKIPAKTHEEQHFDPKTGKDLGKKTVVDEEEHSALVVDGVEYGDHADERIDYGLEEIVRGVCDVKHIYAHSHQDKWGGLIGYVVGFKFDDVNGKSIVEKIAKFDKVAPKIAAAFNKRLKGRQIKINPDGHDSPASNKVSSKAKMYGMLIVG